ncbi:AraC family transcriptional regulator [Stenotrophobium rhamnosiphilum]|uniref:AraC family transcriptional regulator n=1 Tax=Stenotrophobium rhamnosiphilum TaxID=2029166 RepID=A0A2T5MGN1_9GAMM|nr:AraC family transcriptional regulator [Stenotrophobium rhamnosiphilum]PTU31748.1 AraC family transcriptional regulator [Stenotrophobium rhamnosiphilum]
MKQTATALTSWAKAIRKALDAAGVDSARLFVEAGLDRAALDDPNARYAVDATTRLWRLAVAATADEAFGLTVARYVNQTTFHALGYSLTASTTLREAFERMLRYFRLVTDAADLTFELDGDRYRFAICPPEGGAQPAPEAIDAFALLVVRLCRGLYRREFSPVAISLRRTSPHNLSAYERSFRAPITFGDTQNALWFARDVFEQKLEGANPELARHNDEVVVRYLAQMEKQNLRARVHAALIEQLPHGEPSQEKVADTLHMSPRNFQRKLAEEGTSYTELLNDTRRDLALSYVRDPGYSLGEITYLLGFSDASSFNRAFKRWTGQSPSAYRSSPTQK